MYKTLGSYSWTGIVYEPEECPNTSVPFSSSDATQETFESIAKSAQEFNLALDNLKMVSFFICICKITKAQLFFRCFQWKCSEDSWALQLGGVVLCILLVHLLVLFINHTFLLCKFVDKFYLGINNFECFTNDFV